MIAGRQSRTQPKGEVRGHSRAGKPQFVLERLANMFVSYSFRSNFIKAIFGFIVWLVAFSPPVLANVIKIPWKGDYAHNFDATYSVENKYRSGMSKNFMNGAPEEDRRVQRDGELQSELIRPKNSIGPISILILMHGCSGLTGITATWAKEKAQIFVDQGIGVLILDSFRTRNVKAVCGEPNYHWGWRRAEDAYSALDYLIENKIADPNQVYIMGRSNGGTAALMASDVTYTRGHRYKFAGAFAVSPGCVGLTKSSFGVPTTIFIGDKDTANDPKICSELNGKNNMVHVVVFPGVHHGYEDRTPAYVMSNGWKMEYNSKADKETITQTLAVIKSKN
jgi:dienelactone hydrolase